MTQDSDKHNAATQPWSVRMVDSVIRRGQPFRWHYECGLMLRVVEHVWLCTNDSKYYDYIRREFDPFIGPDGSIKTYTIDEYNLDQIRPGCTLFMLYRTTGEDRYKKAAYLLREQLRRHPRTSENGFWHKKIYPFQMWLDGLYMAGPFYAQFGQVFGEPAAFDDVVLQATLMEKHMRDAKTGLLYHGWDESRQQRWANPETGCSPHFWGRAMGWYMMALVDILDYLPADHPGQAALVEILQRAAEAVIRVQDAASGVWYQVLDQGGRAGNYLEASASCMFVYALVKGVRERYLDRGYLNAARRGYQGILQHFVRVDEQGLVNLDRICRTAGLGGTPYRDGSYEYYIGEVIVSNDYKGVGPFVLASLEMENLTPGHVQSRLTGVG